MSTAATSALVEALDAQAEALANAESGRDAGLAQARRAAREAGRRHGLPTTRQERWKYTALRALGARRFDTAPSTTVDVDADALSDIPAPRLVLVNGQVDVATSRLDALPAGVRVRTLSEVLRDSPGEAADWLDADTTRADAVFPQWNAALATEGLVLEVDAGIHVDTPLHLVELTVDDGSERALHLRHRLVLGAGAALTLVQHQRSLGRPRHLSNGVVDLQLGDGARLVHARVQQAADTATQMQHTRARLGATAHYRRLDLELGAALSRHELDVVLAGDGAQLDANGVLLANGRRHVDTRLGIEHRARDTRCELTWRGFGAGRGRAVFHGGILIAEGADGSNAALSNKNLLLDDGAEIDTQPVLVIHADDVQAAHGATVGRLDPQSLFYLRARGLPQAEATALLTAAFLREPLAVLADEALDAALSATLDARLAEGAEAGSA